MTNKHDISLFDKLACSVAPKWGMERLHAKLSINAFQAGYDFAGNSKRTTRGWGVKADSPNGETKNLEAFRATSRDLFTNAPLSLAVLKRIKTSSVGSGLKLQSRIDRRVLGLSPEQADEWERTIEDEFNFWASKSENCDFERTLSFFEMQGLVLLSELLNGDAFFFLPYKAYTGNMYELKVRLVEADLCCNPNDSQNTQEMVNGIELDSNGVPYKYHFVNKYKNDSLTTSISRKWIPVNAFDEQGNKQVYHIFEPLRIGQRRGIPFLTPIFATVKQLSRLSEAQLQNSIISAYFTVFVKDSAGFANLAPSFADSIIPEDDTEKPFQYEMGSANIIELDQGKEIQIADPRKSDKDFETFYLALVKQIASACEIPFEVLMQTFNSSYSASRASINEAWKFFKQRRTRVANTFCKPVFEAFVEEAVLSGRIKAKGFFDSPIIRNAWCGSVWIGQGKLEIDPLKETKASILKIANNLSSYEDEYTSTTGEEWENLVVRRSREDAFLKANGLDPNPTNELGLDQPETPAEPTQPNQNNQGE